MLLHVSMNEGNCMFAVNGSAILKRKRMLGLLFTAQISSLNVEI